MGQHDSKIYFHSWRTTNRRFQFRLSFLPCATIDNILLEKLEKYDFPALKCAWSRLDNYEEYLQMQNWLRQKFTLAPMDVEFMLWLGQEIEN
jgi:hypothetical protein